MSEEEKGKKVTVTLSDEDIKAINDDLKATKESLVSSETEKIRESAKEEAKKELEAQREIENQQKENEALKEKLQKQEQETADKLDKFQSKIDNLVGSKATIVSENPFDTKPAMSKEVDNWSDEKVNSFEEESARRFFGSDYDTRM